MTATICCPHCEHPMTPRQLEAHLRWNDCDELTAKRDRSRRLHPSNPRPTDGDGAA